MIPTVSGGLAITLIVVTFIGIAGVLLAVLMGSTIRQQRRYLRTREHLGGRLLKAQDDERAAIARELHDDSVQRLLAAATRLRSLESTTVSRIADDLDRLIDDLRNMARGIHPAIVDHVGLAPALGDLCSRFEEREQIVVDLECCADPDWLSPPAKLALYRVAQEALGNVARHAAVSRVGVRLSAADRALRLVVEDRGAGFDDRKIESGPGLGVTSMRERLAILGGELRMESAPGRGTTVTATVPQPGANT